MAEEYMPLVVGRLEEAYRFRPATQIGLFIILAALGLWLVNEGAKRYGLSLDTVIIVMTIYLALLYPLIIKMRNRASIAVSFGLFGAALASIIYWLLKHMMPVASLRVEALALYVIFLEIVGMELFHHLCEEYVFYERDWRSYLLVGLLSAVFFACLWFFLGPSGCGLEPSLTVLISVVLTMMFAWAVLPEKPI